MMTKYTIMTELVKAGCDLDKLPSEILEAIENACLNPAAVKVQVQTSESRSNPKSELIASLMILKNSTFTRDEAASAIDHISNGNYDKALRSISYMATWQDNLKRKDENLYEAFIKASSLIGEFI